MAASQEGHVEVVDKLLQHGATVDLQKEGGLSPLMMCCEQGDSEMTKLLLDSQANPNLQQSNTGYTALMFACNGGHLATVKVLMEHGADPLIRNLAGVTALSIASANEFPDVCNELNHWGQPDSTTDVEHPATSTAKDEVDEVVSRFRGQMLAETPYDHREQEEGVDGKKVPKGDYKRYLKIRAFGATLWRTGKRKVKASIETLYFNLN
ncbi:Ankyrin repeat and KH domain-containing protein 1 [Geodia barretti]|uniref:Ankyrin repeat and KH domain-containing protein 1 n=1 Tax=Geodia barretti TaxID=519541 RepID=A0AA35WHC7_GEOBA|nr:Ankyrin repeat and KH domain-containing protein 1 [Geodia barretti]